MAIRRRGLARMDDLGPSAEERNVYIIWGKEIGTEDKCPQRRRAISPLWRDKNPGKSSSKSAKNWPKNNINFRADKWEKIPFGD